MPAPIDELFFVIRTNPDPSGTAKIFGIYESHVRADDNILEFNKDPATSGLYEVAVMGSGIAGPPGSGNTLGQAYNQNGAGAGRIITADTGAVQIDGSNQLSFDVTQAENFGGIRVVKVGTGAGVVVSIENDGTGDGLFLNQDANGISLNIDSEATGSPLIALAALNANTRGDLAFGTTRTGDPSTPTEGDVWYNSTDNNLWLYDGTGNVDLTVQGGGGGNTLNAAYDEGGAGAGRAIAADTGAVLIIGSNQRALHITQADNFPCVELDKNGAGAGAALDIDNAGTGAGVLVTQVGDGIAVDIVQGGDTSGLRVTQNTAFFAALVEQTNNATAMRINKSVGGAGGGLEVENDGVAPGILINQDGVGVALSIDSESISQPLIALLPLNANVRGDINFSTARTADPTTPSEGDLWYNSTDNNLWLFDGVANIDLTAGGSGNTLNAAYDEGGAGAGRIITADTGAVQIDGSNQLAVDINQAGNFSCLALDKNGTGFGDPVLTIDDASTGMGIRITNTAATSAAAIRVDQAANGVCVDLVKTATGAGNIFTIVNAGTGFCINIDQNGAQDAVFIRQDGNGIPLCIDNNASSEPSIEMRPLNSNTRGDISFGTARISDPSAPLEGDIWYNATDNNLWLFDGVSNVDLTAGGGGGGNTLDAAYDEGGAGAGRTITADTGAVQITGSAQTMLDIDQTGNFIGVDIVKTGTGANVALSVEDDGTGGALFLNQDGSATALSIDSEATGSPLIDLAPITGNSRGDIAFGTARTGDPSSPSEGDFWYHGTDEFLRYRDSAKNVSLTGIGRKSILVEDPTASEDLTMFFTEEAITVRQVEGVLRGSATPTVTISVMHNTDRNAAGNNVLTAATAITSTTTGDSPAIGGDVTIPANSFVWLETSAQGGTVDEINVTIKFTED